MRTLQMSDLFRDYMQGERQGNGHDDPIFVQVVECIAALASPELVAEMVLFM